MRDVRYSRGVGYGLRPSVVERVTVDDVFRIAKFPMPVERGRKIRCPNPDHHDRHPSAEIWRNRKGITCHSACGKYWGVLDLSVLLRVARDRKEAASVLEETLR